MKLIINKIIKYVAGWVCGLAMIIGLSALIFEDDMAVRIIGGISALVAVIIGNVIWRKQKPIGDPDPVDLDSIKK